MQIELHGQDVRITPALRQRVQHQVAAAFGALAHRVGRVRVHLADVNGPRGGVDKQCTIEVHAHRLPPLVARQLSASIYAALDSAIGRLTHILRRRVDRRVARLRRAALPY